MARHQKLLETTVGQILVDTDVVVWISIVIDVALALFFLGLGQFEVNSADVSDGMTLPVCLEWTIWPGAVKWVDVQMDSLVTSKIFWQMKRLATTFESAGVILWSATSSRLGPGKFASSIIRSLWLLSLLSR